MSFLTNFHGWLFITEMSCVPNDHFPAFEIENGFVIFEHFETVIYLYTSNQVVQRRGKPFFFFFSSYFPDKEMKERMLLEEISKQTVIPST